MYKREAGERERWRLNYKELFSNNRTINLSSNNEAINCKQNNRKFFKGTLLLSDQEPQAPHWIK